MVLAVAGTAWLVGGGALGPRDETARAESIGGPSLTSAAVPIPIPPARETRPELSPKPFLSASADVISCPQPTVGAFRPTGSACMRTTLPEADIAEEARAVPPPSPKAEAPSAVPVAAAPSEPAQPRPEARGPTVTASLPDNTAVGKTAGPSPVKAAASAAAKPPAVVKVGALDAKLKGKWMPRVAGCTGAERPSDCLSLTVGPTAAKAGSTTCRFSDITRDGNRWNLVAQCSGDGDRWTSHVQLTMAGKRMSWTSERGRQDYLR